MANARREAPTLATIQLGRPISEATGMAPRRSAVPETALKAAFVFSDVWRSTDATINPFV
jgi:hypothetical protein